MLRQIRAVAILEPIMGEDASDILVTHDHDSQEFRIQEDGRVAVLQYRRRPDAISFLHTEVPVELRGRGLGGMLARAGLSYATAEGLAVVAICPFIKEYIRRHPEFGISVPDE